jgi:anaerobic magnesium-protoporphyrin IX monomethyl ester cyclase
MHGADRNAAMSTVLLIYPFFKPRRDRSVFRFPPLGISYIAASLRSAGHAVTVIDCTFLKRTEALHQALEVKAEVVGVYCMVTMVDDSAWFARALRKQSQLLVAGGPLPTCDPTPFLEDFDVVVRGEGEQTILDLLDTFMQHSDIGGVAGIAYLKKTAEGRSAVFYTKDRPFTRNLNQLAFPARELLPNDQYIRYSKKKYGYSITTVMSTRGCPYRCEFCSNVVFGGSYRERSPENVVDEIEEALRLGYDRISFADDVFTMKRDRVVHICDEILRRKLIFKWECLGRVDALDAATAEKMKLAGCTRIYFGIESANEDILDLMQKRITPEQARNAVILAHEAGLEVGGFFILFYPGDTDDTVLQTLHFTTSLPFDYLGLSMPYPLPGTVLFERVRERINRDWHPDESPFGSHVLIFDADFSELKMWFGIIKGHTQFRIKKSLGKLAPSILTFFEKVTDWIFRLMK